MCLIKVTVPRRTLKKDRTVWKVVRLDNKPAFYPLLIPEGLKEGLNEDPYRGILITFFSTLHDIQYHAGFHCMLRKEDAELICLNFLGSTPVKVIKAYIPAGTQVVYGEESWSLDYEKTKVVVSPVLFIPTLTPKEGE